MSRQIKDIKDFNTGLLVYPRTHVSAVVGLENFSGSGSSAANVQALTRLGYEEFEERPARDAVDLTTGEKVYFYGDAAYIGVSYTGGMLLDYIDDKISPIRIIKWDVEPTTSVEIPEDVSYWANTQEGILILNGGVAIIVVDDDSGTFYIQSCITKGDNIVITKVYSYQFTDREEILIESYPISGGGSGGSITVDTSMSSTSTNPVQNKVIKSYIDSNCNIPTETTTASSKSLTANKYCRWTNTPTNITITLTTPSNTNILNNYMFEFTTGSSGCTLSVPSTIKWINGVAPTIEAGKTYQISIINNLATVAKFS